MSGLGENPSFAARRRSSAARRAVSWLRRNRSRKLQLLGEKSPLGAYLSAFELTRLAKLCSIVRFSQGKAIRADSPFYLVIDGVVAVMDDDERTELTSRRAGAFFTRHAGRGRVSAGKEKGVEAMLVGKSAGSVLLAPDEAKLEAFYGSLTGEGREGYDAIISTNISTVLSSVKFISEAALRPAALRKCGELCSYVPHQPGDVVFAQGDAADSFFIVLKGTTEVVIDEKQLTGAVDTERQVGGITRGYGETFGVAALVLGAPVRQYGMKTNDRSLFIRISFADFRPFLDNHPKLEKSLLYSTKLFLVQRYSTMPSSIFSAFNGEELQSAAELATLQRLSPGQVVYSVGEEPEAFYVVAHGEVQRDYEDGSPPLALHVGNYFGEVGMLLPSTRCFATIKATTDSTLLSISKDDFGSVCTPEISYSRAKAKKKASQSSVARSPSSMSHADATNKAHGDSRSLHHALLVELLIKLRRSDVRMHVLLQHPRAHTDFVEFAIQNLGGVLRVEVYNHASTMLQRVRAAIGTAPNVSAETEVHMKQFLDEQAKVFLADQLRRRPCPRFSDEVFARVAEREAAFAKHFAQHSATLPELDALLTQLCATYDEVLQIGHHRYVESGAFAQLLEKMGAYADGVAGLVGAEAVQSLAHSFDMIQESKGAKDAEYKFVPLETSAALRRHAAPLPSPTGA